MNHPTVDQGAREAAARNTQWNTAPRCSFHVRKQVTDDPPTYSYDALYVRGGGHGQTGMLVTPWPPTVGDLIFLTDGVGDESGIYRVVERSWSYSGYGSVDWPLDSKWSSKGPLVNVIVVPDTGPFRDEAELPDDPEEG